MHQEFRLPDVGEGITEGEIVNWMVSEGDQVEEDEAFVEVETDKAIIEIPSPVDGVVNEIHADEGDIVDVGEVLITFEVSENVEMEESTGEGMDVEGDGDKPRERFDAEVIDEDRVFASPKTRRVARELGVDLSEVQGSGEGGRILEEDVREVADESLETRETIETRDDDQGGSMEESSERHVVGEEGIDMNDVSVGEKQGIERDAGEGGASSYLSSGEDRVEYRGVRRSVGESMEESSRVPQVTHHDEADVTRLVEAYPELKREAERYGVELSYTSVLVRACVAALDRNPKLNSSLDMENEEIVLKEDVNIGVATATQDGLIVPVLKEANEKSLLETAEEVNMLAEKARSRELEPEELQDGTFTVTNIGVIGGEYATPLVNPPEAAILAVGEFKRKPRVVNGEIAPRTVAGLSLSIDHRVVDGADAAHFTNEIKRFLSTPELLLTEQW